MTDTEPKTVTVRVTTEMDDDVKALVAGWKQRALDAEAEIEQLKRALKAMGEISGISGEYMKSLMEEIEQLKHQLSAKED